MTRAEGWPQRLRAAPAVVDDHGHALGCQLLRTRTCLSRVNIPGAGRFLTQEPLLEAVVLESVSPSVGLHAHSVVNMHVHACAHVCVHGERDVEVRPGLGISSPHSSPPPPSAGTPGTFVGSFLSAELEAGRC